MLDWDLARNDPQNRVPPETEGGAQTWWQYLPGGEAAWAGTAPHGARLVLDWDGMGALRSVESAGGRHEYLYAPSGMRVLESGPRGGRLFAYTASGALLSVSGLSPSGQIISRTDIVRANGMAVAEVSLDGTVSELHPDHLGSPRYVTDGGTGQLVGGQVFGPYGERMDIPNLTWGRATLTGYTGHIAEDETGLIYMGARYYSPGWHRFLSPDGGADPLGPNQYAYVGGSPFTATDPSGLKAVTMYKEHPAGWDFLFYFSGFGTPEGGGGRGGGGGGGAYGAWLVWCEQDAHAMTKMLAALSRQRVGLNAMLDEIEANYGREARVLAYEATRALSTLPKRSSSVAHVVMFFRVGNTIYMLHSGPKDGKNHAFDIDEYDITDAPEGTTTIQFIEELPEGYKVVRTWEGPASSITDITLGEAVRIWNDFGHPYNFAVPSPDSTIGNNCYAFKNFLIAGAKMNSGLVAYDAARPR
jgi:RHS repeat-associated protein